MNAKALVPKANQDRIRFVTTLAQITAVRIARFLQAIDSKAVLGRKVELTAGFLMRLGAGLTLLDWELAGLFPHRDAGLSDARAVLTDAFHALLRAPDPGPG